MEEIVKLVGDQLLSEGGSSKVNTVDVCDNAEVIGLYFSAHWCPPCRGFTPVLSEQYKKYKDEGKKFVIIFVSSDRDEDSFKDYFKDMPWYALPYEDRDKKEALCQKYGITGIPSLILLDGKGNLKHKDGRAKIQSEAGGFPWN